MTKKVLAPLSDEKDSEAMERSAFLVGPPSGTTTLGKRSVVL